MKVINQKNDNLWSEVERSLAEHTPSGYKMACIEADKAFKYALREKGYPRNNTTQVVTYFGWCLTDKDGLKKALEKTIKIKETFDYQLSSFESEDVVLSYKQAVKDFSEKKALSWKRRVGLFYKNHLSIRFSYLKKVLIFLILFFVVVNILTKTNIGKNSVNKVIKLSDLLFTWFLPILVLLILISVMTIVVFTFLERKKIRIKEIEKKRT